MRDATTEGIEYKKVSEKTMSQTANWSQNQANNTVINHFQS